MNAELKNIYSAAMSFIGAKDSSDLESMMESFKTMPLPEEQKVKMIDLMKALLEVKL